MNSADFDVYKKKIYGYLFEDADSELDTDYVI